MVNISSFRAVLGIAAIALAQVPLVALWIRSASAQNVVFDSSFSDRDLGFGPTYDILVGDGLLSGNGQNIFYSFDRFSLGGDETANFANGGALNIFSRVTGGSESSIAGTINASANFYLINPSGITFNNGATINVTGAFVASTSPGLFFDNDTIEFRALNPDPSNDALLTIATDVGSFNQVGREGSIEINGALEGLQNLELLYFDARNLVVNGSGDPTSVTPGVELPGGLIFVDADNVSISESVWSTQNALTSGSSGFGPSGGIAIFASGLVEVDNSLLISASSPTQVGDAGIILIRGSDLLFENFTQLQAQTSNAGQAGVVALFTNDRQGSVTFRNQSFAFSSVEPPGISNNSGQPNLFASLFDSFFTDSVLLNDFSDLFYVLVDTGTLILDDSSGLLTVVRGAGDDGASSGSAGWVGISADNVFILNSSGIRSDVLGGATGPSGAGAVVLEVNNLLVDNGSVISTSIFSDGQPGVVAVLAREDVVVQNSSAIASAVLGGANATAFTSDDFQGAVVIGANRLGINNNSAITVTNSGSGFSGDISIFSNLIALSNNSEISAETFLSGEGGNIDLSGEFLVLAGNSDITTNSGGNGGNINLDIRQAIYGTPSRDSNILAQGGANGGNITFSESIFLLGIAPRDDDFSDSNDISPSGQLTEGAIVFRSGTQDLNPVQEQVTLPTNLVDPSRLIAQGCAAGNLTAAQEIGEFVVTGRGGLPPSPGEQVGDLEMLPDLVDSPATGASAPLDTVVDVTGELSSDNSAEDEVTWVEAQSWRYGEDGEVVLMASTRAASTPRWLMPGCDDVF